MLRFVSGFLWATLLPAHLSSAETEEQTRPHGWFHFNGYTHHVDAPGENDQLYGLGWKWYHQRWPRVMQAWEADAFRDSLPVGLPFVECPLGRASMRGYYVPPVRRPCDQQISFQLLIPFLR